MQGQVRAGASAGIRTRYRLPVDLALGGGRSIAATRGRENGLSDLQVDYADCDHAAIEKQVLFANISFEQLTDSVDTFYSDPINRQVTVPDALTYLRRQIRGETSSALQTSLEEIRRAGNFNRRARDK
jgi:hypothetical protein